jgi:hypothetical protein
MQSGELFVVGKDHVTIHLHGNPQKVVVQFKDEHHITPCNPNDFDELEWEVERHLFGYVLRIKWQVTDVREIKWEVDY